MTIPNTPRYECISKAIIEEINTANGMKLVELVPKMFNRFWLTRSETEGIVDQMIGEGKIRILTYRCNNMDRWHGFLLTNKYEIQIDTGHLHGRL